MTKFCSNVELGAISWKWKLRRLPPHYCVLLWAITLLWLLWSFAKLELFLRTNSVFCDTLYVFLVAELLRPNTLPNYFLEQTRSFVTPCMFPFGSKVIKTKYPTRKDIASTSLYRKSFIAVFDSDFNLLFLWAWKSNLKHVIYLWFTFNNKQWTADKYMKDSHNERIICKFQRII